MKQQNNEISALRSKLASVMNKQPIRHRVFNTNCIPAEEVVVDTAKELEEKVSANYEKQLAVLRNRITELEGIVKENNAVMNVTPLDAIHG